MKHLCILLFLTVLLAADGPGRIQSKYSARDFAPSADPDSADWKGVTPVLIENDRYGKPVAGHRTEVRSRWTETHVYFLFVCPYDKLYLKPSPTQTKETNKLWDWDVAEVFIGWDAKNIHLYKEFQVSPQGEWVDLDIDRKQPKPENGWMWNSGFLTKARIDAGKKVWYGEMKIPLKAIDTRAVKAGNELRINCFRIQGPGPDRTHLAWQPPHQPSYHTPEAFGKIVLVK